jgi:LuxR family maltose regulon positive regulatory protein
VSNLPTPGAQDLILRVTPPRAPRDLLSRARLMANDPRVRDAPVVLVQAPAGFGKTSLLAQWRLEHLAQGAAVAWLSAQQRDDPQRLVQGMALAVRIGAGRPSFGHTVIEGADMSELEAVTRWLAELAQLALRVVLVLDEAERLQPPALELLAYALRNLPPNVQAIIAARPDVDLGIDDLINYGQCVVIGAASLRFTLDETLELVRGRPALRLDADAAARLHDITEGWPLGLQLALTAATARADVVAGMPEVAGAAMREHLVGLMLSRLDPLDAEFLTQVAVLDDLHPALCQALTGAPDAAERLQRMSRDTPVVVAADQGEWLRLHMLAREVLLRRFESLPAGQRARLHARAADWLLEQGFLEAAAKHALAAGRQEMAYSLAEGSLYDSFFHRGRQGAVLDWLVRLPEAELDRRPRLRLAAAWSLALSERHDEAGRLIERTLAQPDIDDALRCECALILSGAAVFADDPDRFAALHDPWAEVHPLRNELLLRVHANRSAFRVLLEGEPALARLRQQQGPGGDEGRASEYIDRWGEFIVALSYLWEGQVLLAESLLRPALARVDAELGRRSRFACMMAALLAAAVWQADRPAEAVGLLANRLDVLERSGLPEAVLLAYLTLVRAAVRTGEEHRALELLGSLHAVGLARRLPRLCIMSLVEQVRLHARRYRPESCRELCGQIERMLADPALPQGRLWRRSVEVLRDLAQAYAALSAREWRAAVELLLRTEALARELKQGRFCIELQGLRAFALDRCGERARPLLQEAVDLAGTFGLRRVFADAHPDLERWVDDDLRGGESSAAAAPAPAARPAGLPTVPRSSPSMALTPKEREVLELLARNLSNKEIGRALQVGEETIKWHMKNLFAKLDAGTRKQVVQRARILGLLEPER